MALPSSNSLLRIAIIGAGAMGHHHLRICSLLKGIDLVGVLDIQSERAQEAGRKFSCKTYNRLEDLLGKVDAVIIAVPTHAHASIALFFLQNGIHCLIEKPFALTEQECLSLITLAEQQDLVLAVGHVEHYNAGVQTLRKVIDEEGQDILSIDAFRLNYGSRRVSDVDVVLDLMVHDLEIVESLINCPLVKVEARTTGQAKQRELDHVVANLTFQNGTIANLTASRITPNCVRKLYVTTSKAYFSLDYQTQELLKFELLSERTMHLTDQIGLTDNVVCERIPVRAQDALMSEISAFRESIFFKTRQYVDGRSALSCLKLAWKIQREAKSEQPTHSDRKIMSKQI